MIATTVSSHLNDQKVALRIHGNHERLELVTCCKRVKLIFGNSYDCISI